VDQIVKDFGKLDVIVANAGICSEHAGEDCTPEEFLEVMDVNVNGAFYTAQAAAKVFKQQGFGNVVFTASVSASLVNTPQRQASVSPNTLLFVSWMLEFGLYVFKYHDSNAVPSIMPPRLAFYSLLDH
jgi:NAD(P)-dependent dehydrogenase (short-subunit alcohol dehydrogenase family)